MRTTFPSASRTRRRARKASSLQEPDDVPRRDGSGEALQGKRADLVGLDQRLDRRRHVTGDEDLAGVRLAAEARGEIRHRSDRAIVPTALEADRADRGIAARDADAETQVPAALAPAAGELPR